ncbi:hypothetical protein V6R21_06535 [Limibacter armeniacum]|uniref:DUF6989 domain-containing protein n=1 Tax=Limibacter armeniacum TaxID=466084 RepID=UPI002FE519EE
MDTHPSLEIKSSKAIYVTLAVVVLGIFSNSFFCTGWHTAALLAFGVYSSLVIISIINKDVLLQKLLVFALVAGFAELFADNWLVNTIKILEYEKGPSIMASPIYMPFAWATVLTQIGFVGWQKAKRMGMWKACLLAAALGGLVIPLYEYSAYGACWWYYNDPGHMIFYTPYLIIIGEALLSLVLPVMIREIVFKKSIVWIVPAGVVMGLWIWGSYYIGYLIAN